MRTFKRFCVALLVLVFLLPAPSARATFSVNATILNGGSIPLTATNWSPATSSIAASNPFKVEQFNPAAIVPPQGETVQFTGVGISLTYDFRNTISIRFDDVSTISVSASGIMHLRLPDNVTDLTAAPTFANSATLTSKSTDTFPKTVTLPTKDVPGVASMGYTQAQPTVLAQFLGTGTIDLPVFAAATSSFTTSSGNGLGTSDTLASASISVVYDYTFVPEPSSMVLTGLGGVGLLTVYRGRARRKE